MTRMLLLLLSYQIPRAGHRGQHEPVCHSSHESESPGGLWPHANRGTGSLSASVSEWVGTGYPSSRIAAPDFFVADSPMWPRRGTLTWTRANQKKSVEKIIFAAMERVVAIVATKLVVSVACAVGETVGEACAQQISDVPGLLRLAKGGAIDPKDRRRLQAEATAALCNLARNSPTKKDAIREAGGIPVLVELAREGTGTLRENATRTLMTLSVDNWRNKEAIREAGGLSVLLGLARGGTDMQRELATIAIACVVGGTATNKDAIREAGGIHVLMGLTIIGTDKLHAAAANALANLAVHNPTNQAAIREAGGVAVLVGLARDGTDTLRNHAAIALGTLAAGDPTNQDGIREAGGVTVLVGLMRTQKTPEQAARALGFLAADNPRNQDAVRDAGGIGRLVGLATSGTDKEKEVATEVLMALATRNPTNQEAIRESGCTDLLVGLLPQEPAASVPRNLCEVCLRFRLSLRRFLRPLFVPVWLCMYTTLHSPHPSPPTCSLQ